MARDGGRGRVVVTETLSKTDDGIQEPEVRVVIVDDRPTNRAIYSRLAASVSSAVRVTCFGDAHAGLAWLDENAVDLVITDYKMPDLNGAEMLRRIRRQSLNRDVPAFVITAYSDREFRVAALEAGATDFLHSPVDPYEFRTRVRNLLRLGQQQRLLRKHAADLALELSESEATRLRVIRQSRSHLAQVIDTVPAMISAMNRDGRLVFINAFQAQLAGREVAGLLGSSEPLFGVAHHQSNRALDAQVFDTGRPVSRYEEEIQCPDGSVRWMLTTKAPLHDENGAIASVLTTAIDITARREAELRLRVVAREDPLTGLCNRRWFVREVQNAVAQSRRGDRGFALHFLDLDRFKLINDGLGHHVGDKLIKEMSSRLASVLGDQGVAGRLGGDEFGVLQLALPGVGAAEELARRMLSAISMPAVIDGNPISGSASVGIAIYPQDGRTVDDLLRSADLAMYAVKIAGRRGYRLCGDTPSERETEDRELERDLCSGLARKQLVLHYQPQLSSQSSEVVGVEALVRWNRPGWGLLAPAAFLPVAERSGLSAPLGEWVVHGVCEQISAWQDEAGIALPVSVNLSPAHTREQNLAESILGAAEAARVDPRLLIVEVTEGCIETGGEVFLACLARLRSAGAGICVDNFGVKELPLSALKRASVTRLKLELSLVEALEADDDDARLALDRAVVYARALGAEIAAIGVETQKQLDRLRDGGCEIVQGAYIAKPVQASALLRLLQSKLVVPGATPDYSPS